MLKLPLRISRKSPPFESAVNDHEGPCFFTWENKNQIDSRVAGGVTGFFRKAEPTFIPWVYKLTGKEFHGIIFWDDNIVHSTEGMNGIG